MMKVKSTLWDLLLGFGYLIYAGVGGGEEYCLFPWLGIIYMHSTVS